MRLLFFYFLVISCAHNAAMIEDIKDQSHNEKNFFTYEDYSGQYTVTREIKVQASKLISRVLILSSAGVELENQVAVSKFGTISSGKQKRVAILPEASHFKVWYNKKLFESKINVNKKNRTLDIEIIKPPDKIPKQEIYKLPKGSTFCYYSQLPECLKMQNLLVVAAKKPIPLYIIWDNYPFNLEQYQGISSEPVVLGNLSLSKYDNNEFKYIVDIGNQVIFYHYDKSLNFIKMFWVSQGISLVKQLGE